MELDLDDSYTREFKAEVTKVVRGKFIVLNNTAFYPNSGGQPHDIGIFLKNKGGRGNEYRVVYTGRFNGNISHEVNVSGLRIGDKIVGRIEWDRRHLFMRSHTACHILSAVIHKETGAEITGNRIGEERTRVDFSLENFDREGIGAYGKRVNDIIGNSHDVRIYTLPRDDALKIPSVFRLKKAFPDSISEIRIVDIAGVDMQACGGTHVRNTEEIGEIEIIKAENKGKNNRRIYFRLSKD